MLNALTREVSPAIGRCELTHVEREPIDYQAACTQHAAYRALLSELGCTVIALPAASNLPDSVFVEDTAFVVEELAVLSRSGASSRRDETPAIAEVLGTHRPLAQIEDPGTLDGGDVVRLGREVWVGLSSRTNEAGAEQLAGFLQPHGYTIHTVRVQGYLHLKSAVTAIGSETVALNPDWIDREIFRDYQVVTIDPGEPFGANTVLVGESVIIAASHPKTMARLQEQGFDCRAVDGSELAKAEGGLSCCSILFEV
jgi:dimethylargininase